VLIRKVVQSQKKQL